MSEHEDFPGSDPTPEQIGAPVDAPMLPGGQGSTQMAGPVASAVLAADPAFAQSYAAPLDEGAGGFNLRRILAAITRYKYLIAGITVLGTVGGAAATRFLHPQYEAQGTFWLQQGGGVGGPIQQGALLARDSWLQLLRSFEVVETVARQNRYWVQPADTTPSAFFAGMALTDSLLTGAYSISADASGQQYTLARDDGLYSETTQAGERIGQAIGLDWAPAPGLVRPGQRVSFSLSTPRNAALGILQQMTASMDRDATFMRVRLQGDNPRRTAEVLNAVMERFVELARDFKRDKLTEMTRILNEQLASARQSLDQAETALQDFRIRTITLPSDQTVFPLAPGLVQTTDPAYQNFFTMKTEEDQLRQDRQAVERVLATSPDSGLSLAAVELIPAASQSSGVRDLMNGLIDAKANLRVLRQRYTDQNPQVIRALQDVAVLENELIPKELELLAENLRVRESQLTQRIASAGRELQEIPQRSIQEDRLVRTRRIAEQLYADLEDRYQSAQLAERSTGPDVRILDRAVPPEYPTSNQAPLLVLMGFAGSLGAGLALALVLDRLDRRVRYPEQVTDDLGLHILGVIPRLEQSPSGTRLDPIIEAFRGVRLNLSHAIAGHGPLTVTITSPGGGDGKSFTSSNLALAFAEAGHRTLLIDGDVRRGQLHRLFGLPRRPGLTEVLQGTASASEAIRETQYGSLNFLGCGTRTHMAPELVGSQGMSQLLNSARGSYGVIIVDSPPMSAGIDSFALGALTGNMLLVVRTGTTDREMAGAKLDVLERLPIRVAGAVLNDVKPGADGYYYGYYSYYMPGYVAEDERMNAGGEGGTLVKVKETAGS